MRIDRKVIIKNMPFLIFFWIADKLGYLYRISEGNKIIGMIGSIAEVTKPPLFSFNPFDIFIGVVGAAGIKLVIYIRSKNAKKYRRGIEYGSARWGTAEDIKPFMDNNFQNNVILTQTEFLTMESRPKIPKYARNKNVIIIGGSGSGKTRFFVKPNLMQLHSSYLLTDPNGQIVL